MARFLSNQDDLSDAALYAMDKPPTNGPPPRPPVACLRCTEYVPPVIFSWALALPRLSVLSAYVPLPSSPPNVSDNFMTNHLGVCSGDNRLGFICEGGAPCVQCMFHNEQCSLDTSVMNWSYEDMADPVGLWPERWQVAFDELLKATTALGELQEVADVIYSPPHSHDVAAGVVDPSKLTLQPQKFDAFAMPLAGEQLPFSNTDPNLASKTQASGSGLATVQGTSRWPQKRKRGPLTPPEEETPWIYDDPEELHPATKKPALPIDTEELLSSLFPTRLLLESLSQDPTLPGVEDLSTPKPQPPQTFQTGMGRVMSLPDESAPQSLMPPLGNPPGKKKKDQQPPFVRPPFQQEDPLRPNNSTLESSRLPQLGQESKSIKRAAVSVKKRGPLSLIDKVNASIRKCTSSTRTAAEALRHEETTAEQLGLGGRYIAVHLPRKNGQHLFDQFFAYALPTFRFLYQPQVQQWFNEFYSGGGELKGRQYGRNKVVVLLLVLALGLLQTPTEKGPSQSGLE
jgi:hypothetical protein